MEAKLLRLLDCQRVRTVRLTAILADVERSCNNTLADDDLGMVNVAGNAALPSAVWEEPEDDK